MRNFRKIRRLLKGTIAEWKDRDVSLLASALAYSTVFSLAPLVVLVIMLVGAFFGEATAEDEIISQLAELLGKDSAELMANAIANMRAQTQTGTLQLIINLGIIGCGASSVFAQIQSSLDRIWEVRPTPGRPEVLKDNSI